MQEVAEMAGVARATVSYVLNGKARDVGISPGCVDRVMDAVRLLNYRPNGAARAVRRSQFSSVALLLSAQGDRSYLPGALRGAIMRSLAERELHLTLAELPDEKLTSEGYIPRILRELAADGLLVNYTERIPAAMVRLIERHALPAVWINVKRTADCVHPDDLQGGALAAAHLLRQGRRRIAYLDYPHAWEQLPDAHYSAADREAGVRRAVEGAGLTLRLLREQRPTTVAERAAQMTGWLRGEDRPDGVIAYSPSDAIDVCFQAALAGLRVPGDLEVVTFADETVYLGGRPIPTVLVPQLEVGLKAVEMLAAKLSAPGEFLPAVAVKPTFVAPHLT